VEQTERYRALLEINNALISNLDRDALLHAIAEALRPVVPFDRASIFLHDPDRDVIRISILESSAAATYWLPLGTEVSATDSHAGWVFQNREPLVGLDLAKGLQFPIEERVLAAGFAPTSCCRWWRAASASARSASPARCHTSMATPT